MNSEAIIGSFKKSLNVHINVYFNVSIRYTSRTFKGTAGLIDWTAALMYVQLTIPIVGCIVIITCVLHLSPMHFSQ